MESSEYANLDRIEQSHWYYAGKREIVRYWLGRTADLSAAKVLLDCGAGTGLFAKEMEGRCQVLVLDDHEASLEFLRKRFRPEQVLALSGEQIPLADQSIDAVTALDVLEHVEHDNAAVASFARLLKPGGVAVITVPAGRSLWSQWDVSLHHFRRYDASELGALFSNPSWTIEHLAYTNVILFPVVWLVRKLSGQRARNPKDGTVRAEDRIPPSWLNSILKFLFTGPAKTRWRFPFGVSLILVARRR
jgi:SAM-dependent methyltransferase